MSAKRGEIAILMSMALAGLAMLIIGDSHLASISWFNNALQDALVAKAPRR